MPIKNAHVENFRMKALKCKPSAQPVTHANKMHTCISYTYTSKLKILRIKNRDGIKSSETRPGWGEAHNVYKWHVQVPLRGFKPIRMCT